MATLLQRWMDEQGLKDHQVAKELRVSRPSVVRYRNGVYPPSKKIAVRLQELTGHPWWRFMGAAGADSVETFVEMNDAASPIARVAQIADKVEKIEMMVEGILERIDVGVVASPSSSDSTRTQQDALMNVRETCQFFGRIDVSTLYRGVDDGRFPKPIKVGRAGRINRWSRSDCEKALRKLKEGLDA